VKISGDHGLQATLASLFERRQLGSRLSLDGMIGLWNRLGKPAKTLKFIHIAGTNGKGSVAAMSAAMLTSLGHRTGLYTSPHLVRYHERFRLNGLEIENGELEELLARALRVGGDATFFEITTAVALLWFEKQNAEYVAWETGMGGRFDATNIINPVMTIITRIGMDHMNFLGNTIAQIAFEKAGIIKPGVPVVVHEQEPEVEEVIENRAKEVGAPLSWVTQQRLLEFNPPLAGEHQQWNTALAVQAMRLLFPEVRDEQIREGLAGTVWPGRCQLIRRAGKPDVLVDGAHNPQGLEVLIREVRRRWLGGRISFIFGALGDKETASMSRMVGELDADIFLSPVASERGAAVEQLKTSLPKAVTCASLKDALARADQLGRPIVVAGSLFLVGEALQVLGELDRACEGQSHPNETLVRKTTLT
jgi:dihydrofolate synthase / folylpolyglutamate synthase